MTRKKLKLAFISNDSSRKATFKKRKKGLMKKVKELSTLCGINACAIIYSPYDSNPEVWPSNSGVQRVVSELRALPKMDQQKNMVDQETYLRQRIMKASEHLKRQKRENKELEMTEFMNLCLEGKMRMFHMNPMDLNNFGYVINQKLKEINHRFEVSRNSGMEIGESSNAGGVAGSSQEIGSIAVPTTAVPTTQINEIGSSSSFAAFYNPVQQQFQHPSSPHIGLYEQQTLNTNLNLTLNHNQSQQLRFMEMTNHPEQLSYATEQMTFPLMDNSNHNNQHYYQPQHQQQHVHGESSTVSAAISSSNIIPVTNQNFTNNFWFY